MQSARAARTEENVWFKSGGTSVRALFFSGWVRQSEGHPRLGDRLLCLGEGGCRDPQLLLTKIVVGMADGMRRQQRCGALEIGPGSVESGLLTPQGGHLGSQEGDLGIDLLGGGLELPALGAELRPQATGLGLGHREVRLRRLDGGALQRHLHLERFLVELDEQIPLLHAVVVTNQHLHHLTGYPRGHKGCVTVDVSVLGAHRVQCRIDPRGQEVTARRQRGHGSGQQQPLSEPMHRRRADRRLGLGDGKRTVCRRRSRVGVRGRIGRDPIYRVPRRRTVWC